MDIEIKLQNTSVKYILTSDILLPMKYFSNYDPQTVTINMTTFGDIKKYILIVFDYLINQTVRECQYKYNIQVTNDADTTCETNHILVTTNLGFGIPIHEYYMLYDVCMFFGYDAMISVIKEHIQTYCDIFSVTFWDENINDLPIDVTVLLISKNHIDIHEALIKVIKLKIINEFTQFVDHIYKLFKITSTMSSFNKIYNWICAYYKPIKSIKSDIFDITYQRYIMNIGINWYDYHVLSQYRKIIKCHQFVNIYAHYDTLTFDSSPVQTYKHNYPSKPNFKRTIVPSAMFQDKFNKHTDNMFGTIDWSNIVVAGSFIFGLLHHDSSLMNGTTICIYVTGPINVRKAKIGYLLRFFSWRNAFVILNDELTFVIKSFKYDIRIISSKVDLAILISQFDNNYQKIFFNGQAIVGHVDCILALKYKLAKFNINSDENMIQAIKKGLHVPVSKLFCNSKIIQNNMITIPVNNFFGTNKSEIIRDLWNDSTQGMDEIIKYSYCGEINKDYMDVEPSHVLCKMNQLYYFNNQEYIVIEAESDLKTMKLVRSISNNKVHYIPQYVIRLLHPSKLETLVKHFCIMAHKSGVPIERGYSKFIVNTLSLIIVKLNLTWENGRDILKLKVLPVIDL